LIVLRSARRLEIQIEPSAATELSLRSRGTPRIANRLLRRARDYAQVHHDGVLTLERTKSALELYEVDDLGLDRLDRAVLVALIDKFGGGPVGLTTLALAVGEEPETVDSVCEPFLVREGFMTRTSRGRVATPSAWAALGRNDPKSLGQLDIAGG
jgi:Holliday junction DNA helicase RuvB